MRSLIAESLSTVLAADTSRTKQQAVYYTYMKTCSSSDTRILFCCLDKH